MAPLSLEAVAGYAYAVGLRGEPLAIAVAIAVPESGLDPLAHNPNAATGDNSYGLWQINMISAPLDLGTARRRQFGLANNERLFDPAVNATAMYAISSGGTNWKPWTTYKNNKHLPHLEAARAAAQAVERRGGTPGTSTPTTGPDTNAIVPTTSPDVAATLTPVDLNWKPSSVITGFTLVGKTIVATPIAEAITSAELDLTVDQVSQLTMTVTAPDDAEFDIDQLLLLLSYVDWHDLHLEVSDRSWSDAAGPAVLTVQLRHVGVQKLRVAPYKRRTWQNTSPTEVLAEVVAAAGLRFLGQGTVRRVEIANPPQEEGGTESEWQMGLRFAIEEGFWFFESAGLVVFGRPTWLAARMPRFAARWRAGTDKDRILRLLSAHASVDTWREVGKQANDISIEVPAWLGQQVRPGMVCDFIGPPGMGGDYIVTSIRAQLGGDQPVVIDAATPIDPIPAGTGDTAAPLGVVAEGPAGVTQSGRINALDFVTACLEQVGTPYVFGAEALPEDGDPAAFDCSELVEWALRRVGHVMPGHESVSHGPGRHFPDGAFNQWKAATSISVDQARKTRGALLFVGDGTGSGRDAITHVAVSLGTGDRTVEAKGRAYGVVEAAIDGRFTFAGLVPGLAYQ